MNRFRALVLLVVCLSAVGPCFADTLSVTFSATFDNAIPAETVSGSFLWNTTTEALSNIAISSLLNNWVFEFFVLNFELWLSCEGVLWVVLSTERARIETSVSCSGHQVSQSAEVVGSSGEGKQPPDLVDPSQLHFL